MTQNNRYIIVTILPFAHTIVDTAVSVDHSIAQCSSLEAAQLIVDSLNQSSSVDFIDLGHSFGEDVYSKLVHVPTHHDLILEVLNYVFRMCILTKRHPLQVF